MLTPYTIETFGAVNLRLDPLEVGATGALDVLNTDVAIGGEIKTRPGYSQAGTFNGGGATFTGLWTSDRSSISEYVLAQLGVGSGTVVAIFSQTPAISATSADTTGVAVMAFADLATTTNTFTYYSNGATMGRFDHDAVTFSAPTATVDGVAGRAMPKPNVLAVTPASDRLVAAAFNASNFGPNAATSSLHRVYFSEPGNGQSWLTTNWVELGPGDGDQITAAVSWGESLYVFKRNRFFVFYSESEDGDGNPVFNYREVNTGVGCTGPRAVTVTRDGVYFLSRRGLMKTTGGSPVFVGDPVEPLFTQSAPATWTGDQISQSGGALYTYAHIHAFDDRIYMALPGATGFIGNAPTLTLVYDVRRDAWMYWNIPMGGIGDSYVPNTRIRVPWFSHGTDGKIYRLDSTTDAGTAIAWRWTSGRYPLSDPGRVAITQESSVVGSGTVAMSVTTDLYGTIAGPGATLGTAPATAEGWPMTDQEGTFFAHSLSGSGQAVVNRLTHHVSFVKPGGAR